MDFCGSDKKYSDKPQWFDPLGPASIDAKGRQKFTPTGGVEQRNRIFGALDRMSPQLEKDSQALASRLRAAADDPGWEQSRDLARRTLRGDYLNGSPQLDKAMAGVWQRQMADAANNEARMKGAYSRAGMGFSTANQQALQANRTAAAAAAGQTEAAARLSNYDQERSRQMAANGLLESATASPLNYLSNTSTAALSPYATQASIVSGLASGGPVATPNSTIVRQPGVFDYGMAAGESIAGAAGNF